VVMGGGQPNKSNHQEYYQILVLIFMVSSFFLALSLILTGRRYFDRLQLLRTINTIATGE